MADLHLLVEIGHETTRQEDVEAPSATATATNRQGGSDDRIN